GAGGLSGVLRAQVALSTSLHFESVIDGSGELPPVSTTAGGTGVFVLDKSRTRVDYWLTYRGLTGNLSSAAEVRAGAPGATGPVVLEIASAGTPPSATVQGSWTSADSRPLTGALVDSLIAGRLYCNFPTGSHPGGEIRGQLMLKAGIGFVASLDGAQESPPTQTPASGTGSFLLSQDRDRLTYHLTYTGLSGGDSGGSHIHLGAAGETGIVVKTYGPGPAGPEGTIAGVWQAADATEKFSQALAESLITGKLYTNITTGMYSGGEIRGQMNLTTGVGYTSRLSAREDVPPNVVSNGTGTASVVLSPDRQVIAYSLTFHDLTSNISSAGGHFHTGARGFNGGLVKVIVPPNAWGDNTVAGQWSNPDPGSQPLTPAIVDSLIAGHMYINLHTGDYIGGEIRGQLSRDFDVLTSLTGTSAAVPGALHLEQNFPNPFNPATTIRFEIPRASHVTLAVYNMLGQKVATLLDGEKPAGAYTAKFSAAGLGSGVYICRLQAGGLVRTMKLTYLK
ncbi:MAG TPA: CHRD domain-containing protein, partial [Bacteroidota bacterium]|nr:CHRD domain-containing protein [Bacteroidota bacterium]